MRAPAVGIAALFNKARHMCAINQSPVYLVPAAAFPTDAMDLAGVSKSWSCNTMQEGLDALAEQPQPGREGMNGTPPRGAKVLGLPICRVILACCMQGLVLGAGFYMCFIAEAEPVVAFMPFAEMGLDISVLSPASRDLVNRLADSPGARAMVRKLCTIAVKAEEPIPVKRTMSCMCVYTRMCSSSWPQVVIFSLRSNLYKRNTPR